MTDVLAKKQRSVLMSKIRGKWSKIEKRVHDHLKSAKVKHKMHPKMFGSPDILVGEKTVVFVDSCFWHGCSKHKTRVPATNRKFWVAKIKTNKRRDKIVTRNLRKRGFRVVRLWEHNLKNMDKAVKRILEKS